MIWRNGLWTKWPRLPETKTEVERHMKRLLFIGLGCFLLGSSFLRAQVNTERLRVFGDRKGWSHSLQLSGNLARGNADYSRVSASWRTDFEQKPKELFAVAQYERGFTQGKTYVDRGFLHTRYLHRFLEALKTEFFAQAEYNAFIRLKARYLGGGGLRWKAISHVPKTEKPHWNTWVYVGVGGMVEHEEIKDAPDQNTTLFRSTNYWALYVEHGKTIGLNAVAYLQIAPGNPSDFRVLAESNLSLAITKHLALTTAFTYRYDHEPPSLVKRYDMNLTQGLRFAF